jgi:hypothetical protein
MSFDRGVATGIGIDGVLGRELGAEDNTCATSPGECEAGQKPDTMTLEGRH